MKKWKKLLFCIFLLPVIFVMSGCTPFGGDSTLTTEQTQESTTDQIESEGETKNPNSQSTQTMRQMRMKSRAKKNQPNQILQTNQTVTRRSQKSQAMMKM